MASTKGRWPGPYLVAWRVKVARSPLDSIEYHSADVFNTGFDSTGQFLCGDGMFLFDVDRNFEDPRAGKWSNLETASALTADSLETIRLNFRANLNERGLLRPLNMQKIIGKNPMHAISVT